MARPAPFGEVERTLAWRYLRATRANGGVSVVSIISFVGIMLAVMALIVIMSVMSGFRATLLDALLGGQGHVFVQVEGYGADDVDVLAEEITALPDVTAAMPVVQGQVLASSGRYQGGAAVRGIRMEDIDSLPFLDGGQEAVRAIGFGEGKNGGDVILLGRFLAADLNVAPGDTLKLVTPEGTRSPFGVTPRSKVFTVGGLFQTGSVELDKLYILMPSEQAQLFFSKSNTYDLIDVRVREPMETEGVERAILEHTGYQFPTYSWKLEKEAYFGALNTERGMMMIIMLILIVITSLNIITGVVMLVKNKTRDIAILRTIGAGRGSLMRVFIMIGAMLGLTGALIGAALGVTIVVNISAVEDMISWVLGRPLFPPTVYGLDGLPAVLDWGEVVFVTLWAMGMSMLVTIWPAWAAARLDPVEALRFE
ncbi:MAG: lipoprotein-releasing ABC transporter permease subunit [Alphaproteobacteria bacterium]|nr:lipoprotein-releasing ABC transporter permease subunit [Alphaproteobacteria bacterium]